MTIDTPTKIAPGESHALSRLDYTAKKLVVVAGWDMPEGGQAPMEIDFSCFLLDKNDLTREDSDFVFYNQPEGSEGAVTHGDHNTIHENGVAEQTIDIDLQALPYDIVKIVFCISVHEADLRDQYIGMIRNASVRLLNADGHTELLHYPLPADIQNKLVYALVVGTLNRDGPDWHFTASAEEIEGGLGKVATRYGLMITG